MSAQQGQPVPNTAVTPVGTVAAAAAAPNQQYQETVMTQQAIAATAASTHPAAAAGTAGSVAGSVQPDAVHQATATAADAAVTTAPLQAVQQTGVVNATTPATGATVPAAAAAATGTAAAAVAIPAMAASAAAAAPALTGHAQVLKLSCDGIARLSQPGRQPPTPDEVQELIKLVDQIKEVESHIDDIGHAEYVQAVTPVLVKVLSDGCKSVMDADDPVQKLRESVLEVIFRLPTVEPLRQFLTELLQLLVMLLDHENETNALLCCRIISDKCRSFRPQPTELLQRFLGFVRTMYLNFTKMLQFMDASDAGSQAQLHQRLTTQIAEAQGQLSAYNTALNTARDQYSRLHGQYQILQDDAKKMTEEQQQFQAKIRQLQTQQQNQALAAQQAQQGAVAIAATAGSVAGQQVQAAAGVGHQQQQVAVAQGQANATQAALQQQTQTLQQQAVQQQQLAAQSTAQAQAAQQQAAQVHAVQAQAAQQQQALIQQQQAQALQQQQQQQALQQHSPDYLRLSQLHRESVQRLNGNIKQQQIVHAQLKTAQQEYADAQAGSVNATTQVNELSRRLREIEAQQALMASTKAGGAPQRPLIKGTNSFKVLAECRNIVILVFQLYKDLVRPNIEQLVPPMVRALASSPHADPNTSPKIREIYGNFISSQVKTLWFLTYCMNRGCADVVKPFGETLPSCVMYLLQRAPSESNATRKELLISTRHILASDLRLGFLQHLHTLMDESTLVGSSWTAREMLRPLAYSTLADLLHHVRDKLTMQQLERAVHLFLRNIVDESLPMQIQTMSCKLVLNLVQILAPKNETAGTSRNLLMYIFQTFITKLESLAKYRVPRVRRFAEAAFNRRQRAREIAKSSNASSAKTRDSGARNAGTPDAGSVSGEGPMEVDQSPTTPSAANGKHKLPPAFLQAAETSGAQSHVIEPELWMPLHVQQVTDGYVDSIKDMRFLLKTLVNGLKTIIWGIHTCNTQSTNTPGTATRSARLLQAHETYLLHDLLKYGLQCFSLYGIDANEVVRPLKGFDAGVKPTAEEKETIDNFASVFASSDPAAFREVFDVNLPLLVSEITENNLLLTMAQHVLSNPSMSNFFASALLKYLMERLPALGEPDQNISHVLLRLVKLVFGSVNLFSEANEVVLQPHLSDIIHKSMHLATVSEEPENYFLLLRALFRSIGGGKFETLYKEFLPLLPSLLNGLNRLKDGAHTQQLKDLLVELCLTVPVRLSALLPYLHYLMRPLVLALCSSAELVSQGLRTLELCIDNLSPEFLAPIIEPVRPELMAALWQHLMPAKVGAVRSPRHGPTTLRLLGKLGGRNRGVLKHPPMLNPRSHKGPSLRLGITFDRAPRSERSQVAFLAVDEAVAVAVDILKEKQHTAYRAEAFKFLKAALAGMINLEPASDNKTFNPVAAASQIKANINKNKPYYPPQTRKGSSRDVLKSIISGIFGVIEASTFL